MQSFKLETGKERTERHVDGAMDGAWNIENWKLKNITSEKAEEYIKGYWIVGLISVGLSAIFYSVQGQLNNFLFDLVISLILIFCIYKRVVFAAVIFLLYFIVGKIYLFAEYSQYINIGTIIASVAFLNAYIFGTLGVIRWSQLKKTRTGGAIPISQMTTNSSFCSNCGKEISREVKFCGGCGTSCVL